MSEVLLVAARGAGEEHGLYAAVGSEAGWTTRQLDTVEQLAAMCLHPTLPVAYGVSGMGSGGRLLAWNVAEVRSGGGAARIADLDVLGDIPCDLAVSPDGRLLVVANYGYETAGGCLVVWQLDERGLPVGIGVPLALAGSGSDPDRQPVPHPHQIVFDGDLLLVPDLGAERIRRYRYADTLDETAPILTPASTGPRHIVVRRDGLVVSGELSGSIAVLRGASWEVIRGTRHEGPASTRSERNYPGDVKTSADGRTAFFANRGYDTIATVALEPELALVAEVPVPAWPQHILVRAQDILVACWDASAVVRVVGDEVRTAFECPGAGWLIELP